MDLRIPALKMVLMKTLIESSHLKWSVWCMTNSWYAHVPMPSSKKMKQAGGLPEVGGETGPGWRQGEREVLRRRPAKPGKDARARPVQNCQIHWYRTSSEVAPRLSLHGNSYPIRVRATQTYRHYCTGWAPDPKWRSCATLPVALHVTTGQSEAARWKTTYVYIYIYIYIYICIYMYICIYTWIYIYI